MRVSFGPFYENGFRKEYINVDDWDVYCLDETISKLLVPLLKKYKDISDGYPADRFESLDEWNAEIQKMIDGFSIVASGGSDGNHELIPEKNMIVKEALASFAKNFNDLWT